MTDEIAALTKGLEELDKQVEEAMVNRKEDNEDYQTLMANNGAALEISGMAKNRLNKFYNPALVPAAFTQLHMQKDAPPSSSCHLGCILEERGEQRCHCHDG